MDVKEMLLANPEYIIRILKSMGYLDFKFVNKAISFADKQTKKGNCYLWLDEALCVDLFRQGRRTDLMTLVKEYYNIGSYKETVNFVWLLLSSEGIDNLLTEFANQPEQNRENYVYENSDINIYPKAISNLFLDDGIGVYTQNRYDIRFCNKSNRIIIPYYFKGKLVGALGRYNQKKRPEHIQKYICVMKYHKKNFVFGYDNINKDTDDHIIIVESEKSVMRASSLGYNNVIAIGGNNISGTQMDLILELGISNVILALDNGLDSEHYLIQQKRLKEIGLNAIIMEGYGKKECVFDMKNREEIKNAINKKVESFRSSLN